MKSLLLLIAAVWFMPVYSFANDTLSVAQCRALAIQNSPLQQKKLYAESIRALQFSNINSNSLPRVQMGAQATYQSDVFGLPFSFPGAATPEVPKDQYKVSVDIAERIWDGNSDKYLRQQRELERDLATAQVDVDIFFLREVVTDLYFKALLMQESEAILLSSQKELEARLKQAEASVAEGVALRTSVDQIKIQILKTEQQLAVIKADHKTLLVILAKWIFRENADFILQMPAVEQEQSTSVAKRPEYTLFSLQQRGYQNGKDALRLRMQPRIEAFVQGGLGRPNPFNFFETGFSPYYLIGLRAAWTPLSWGNKRRDTQVFDLQMNQVDLQRQFFDQRLETNILKDQEDEVNWQGQLSQDDAIIALQTDIIQRADAQVKNGVMSVTDYLEQLRLLTQAQISRKTHELQAVQAQEMRRAKMED